MRVSFALVIWGEPYVRDFLDFSLPTLLADGNLADIRGIEGSRFQVLTTPGDFTRLEASPLFQRLQRTLPLEFVDISHLRGRDKYHMASRCQVEAIRLSEDYDAIALLYPDVIWSRGAIRFAAGKLAKGALAFFSPAPAVLPEPIRAALATAARIEGPAGAQTIAVEPHKLAGIALDHRHPMWDGFDWDGDCFGNVAACLRWNVADQGWLIRCFHLHPVMMRVQKDNPIYYNEFDISLDADYVARLFDGTDRLDFATDSREFAIVSVRSADTPPFPQPGGRSSVTMVARWAEAHASLLHRAFVNVAFRWHRGNVDEAVWRAVEARSRAIITEVRDRLHTPDSIIRAEDPIAYLARTRRQRSNKALRSPRIALPPSRASLSRASLSKILLYKMSYGALWRTATLIREGALGRRLAQRPALVRLWQWAKPVLHPKSEIDAALSSRGIIRKILKRDSSNTQSS